VSIYINWVQVSLNRVARAGLKEDGELGRLTRAAVASFQEGTGLKPADGVVRPPTVAALVAAGAEPPPVWAVGGLSRKYETGSRGSTAISSGIGDQGGVSYGSYQMTSANGGTVARFVSQPDFPWRNDFAHLTPGSDEFSATWTDIATSFPDAFREAEHEFIKRTHFDPLCDTIKPEDGVDITTCPHAMQDVIWSTAVQHGPGANVVHQAFAQMRNAGTFNVANPAFESNAIVAIYDERGRKDANGVLVHFSHNSQTVQDGVAKRFVDEKADALFMLDFGV
jgi:hypothetical protein